MARNRPPEPETASAEREPMIHAHRTAKIIELVGASTQSFEDAIEHALADAASSTRGITGAHVENFSVRCENGEILEYKVDLKVAFGIESSPKP